MTLTRKSPDAFRTISEVSEILEVPAHVLRFWETRFSQIRPVKRGGGRRYYRPQDIALLRGIRDLLYDDGMTIKGVQKILRERGVRHVTGLGQLAPEEDPLILDAEAADGMEAPLEITAPAAQPIAETSVPEPAPLPEAEPRRPFPQIDMPATGGEPQETQIDLFAHAESQKRRPFPPDPARAKRAATLRGLLGKFIALREKMARDL